MISLIASDLDGTLIKNNTAEIDPAIFDLIRKFKTQGVRFTVASGRQYPCMQRIFAPVQDEIFYVAENGALCVADGIVLSQSEIERAQGLRIMRSIKEMGYYVLLCCADTAYVESAHPEFLDFIRHSLGYEVAEVEDVLTIEQPFLKISACSMADTKTDYSALKAMYEEEIQVLTSGDIWLDFLAPGSDKGHGLRELMRHMKIERDACVAFGDDYNDIAMFQAVDTAYVMNNSPDAVKKHATHTTDSVLEVMNDLLTRRSNP